MTKYQVSYVCTCIDGQCDVTIRRNKGIVEPPIICLLGKNITSVLANGIPVKWELKIQRFKKDD